MEYAQRACELTAYKDAHVLDTLAAAYAASGRFKDAVTTAEKALTLAKNAGPKQTVIKYQGRLELYKSNRPYREE